jgi:hypothetical protein
MSSDRPKPSLDETIALQRWREVFRPVLEEVGRMQSEAIAAGDHRAARHWSVALTYVETGLLWGEAAIGQRGWPRP